VGARDHRAGTDDAPVTLVEYGDFECPSCGLAYPLVRSLQRELGTDLRFVYRHFPLTLVHPHAQLAAEAAEASGAQGRFWEMHDLLYEHQQALEGDDLLQYGDALGLDVDRMAAELADGTHSRRLQDDFRSGVRSGVNGTPTFFVNGERFDEPWSAEAGFLDALRRAASRHGGHETMA
jgi:protein-disulfide isomerase